MSGTYDPRSVEQAHNAAAKVASKTTHEVIARYIEFAATRPGYDTDVGLKLATRVRNSTAIKLVGGCRIEIPRTKLTLILSPTPTDENHTLDMMIPPMGDEEFHNANVEKLRGEIITQVAYVRQLVIAYWIDFRKNKPKLWRDIDSYLGHKIDIVADTKSYVCLFLEVHDAPEKLLSAPNCVIGIDHYYLTEDGKPLSTKFAKPRS